jgi:1-acyl-sn-glycerol-3-phosphate acyltransferase
MWKFTYHFIHLFIYIITKPLFRYKTFGTRNIPKNGSAILASNHTSYADPFFVGLGVVRRINYLAKKELFTNKFSSYFLRNLFRTIPIDREQMEKATLRTIYQLLNANEILLMFPEGTRSFDGKLQQAKIGIGMIAYNSQVPVIPVYVNGSHEILPRNANRVHLKRCSVFFGPPVELSQLYHQKKSKELYKTISEKIMEDIAKLEDISHQHKLSLDRDSTN